MEKSALNRGTLVCFCVMVVLVGQGCDVGLISPLPRAAVVGGCDRF